MDDRVRSNAASVPDISQIEVVAPNLKYRLSGVTSTIIQLVPLQARKIGIAAFGPGLPDHIPHIRWSQLPALFRRPTGRSKRVWHARRNIEMLAGLVLRGVGAPLTLMFTSASQRHHTWWTKFLIRRMEAVVATSRRTAAYLEVPNTVIMHGIDTDRFAPPQDRGKAAGDLGLDPKQLYVGCFGRVRRQKGTDVFIDCMIKLLPEFPRWSAIVAGRATAQHEAFEKELKAKVAAAGLSERILFVGEHKDIDRWYKALTLFIAPQRWEGFGLTPLEAMATGVPVIATTVGAFPELVVEGETGKLIEPGDVENMAEAVRTYLADEQLCQSQAEAGLEHVRRDFSLGREADALIEIYRRLLDKSRS
ncbi:MAG: glycosyltransferase family 4 protein [Rhizobiaceae bacterium]